jgi:hypothetical protein
VNGILDAERSPALRCRVWPLREPAIFKPAQWLDRVRWRLRRPPKPPLKVTRREGSSRPGRSARRHNDSWRIGPGRAGATSRRRGPGGRR